MAPSPMPAARLASVVPAAIDSVTVPRPTRLRRPGRTSPMICGLTATTITLALMPSGGTGFSRTPAAARKAALSAGGAGSTTTTALRSRPPSSQPLSSAAPILPAPTSTSGDFAEKAEERDAIELLTVIPAKAGIHLSALQLIADPKPLQGRKWSVAFTGVAIKVGASRLAGGLEEHWNSILVAAILGCVEDQLHDRRYKAAQGPAGSDPRTDRRQASSLRRDRRRPGEGARWP